jgi:hypothetical protein
MTDLTNVEQLARELRKAIGKSTAGKQLVRDACRYTLIVTDGEYTALDGTILPGELRPLFGQLVDEMPKESDQ